MDDDARGCVGGVGEPVGHADVAGGVDATVGRLEVVVDHNTAFRIVADPDGLEVEALDVGRAPGTEENLINRDDLLAPGALQVNELLRA